MKSSLKPPYIRVVPYKLMFILHKDIIALLIEQQRLKTEAVFLVVCDPSINELWAT